MRKSLSMDKELTKKLVSTREILRNKLKLLKADIATSKESAEAAYLPITEPLKAIVDQLQTVNVTPKTEHAYGDDESLLSDIKPNRKYFKDGSLYHSTPTKRKRKSLKDESLHHLTPHTSQRKNFRFLKLEDIESPSTSQASKSHSEEVEEVQDEEPDDSSFNLSEYSRDARQRLEATKKRVSEDLQRPEIQDVLQQFDALPRTYIEEYNADVDGEFDKKYGVREVDGDLYIGSSKVDFVGPNITVNGFEYRGTPGFYELVFKKKPGKFTYSDVRQYKDLLTRTNAARLRYNPQLQISANKAFKYVDIIKPILAGRAPNVWWAKSWKTGSGYIEKQHIPNVNLELQFWSDPNNLVKRLRLLIASKAAGNNAHTNEILSIEEELKNANIIY